MRLPIYIAWLPLVAACGGEGPVSPGGAELEVGSANADGTAWTAVPEGADVDLIPGSQGGFHVWVDLKVRGCTGTLRIEREAHRVSDGQLLLHTISQPIDVPPDAMDGWWQMPKAVPAFMCPSPIGVAIVDEEVRIDVRLLDTDGTLLGQGQLVVVPRCTTQQDFCLSICSG